MFGALCGRVGVIVVAVCLTSSSAWAGEACKPRKDSSAQKKPQQNGDHSNKSDKSNESKKDNSFFANLSAYEPMYFIIDPSDGDAKFQLSFKYRLFSRKKGFGETVHFLSDFYFAYTQASFWALGEPSKPFTDSSFRPEVFYCNRIKSFGGTLDPQLDLQVGIFHESNGKSGADSRSLNAVYVKPSVVLALKKGKTKDDDNALELTLAAQAWQYVGSLSDNPNIGDYRGHLSVLASIGDSNGLIVSSQLRGGITSGKGNIVVNASYPLNKWSFSNLALYLHAQVYSGYGEDLLDYNHKSTTFRIGFGLSR